MRRSHRCERPPRHGAQKRQEIMFSTATRSPTSTDQRFAARSPIFAIRPSGSCPGIAGTGVRSTPANCS